MAFERAMDTAHWPAVARAGVKPPTFVITDEREVVRFLHDELKLTDSEIAQATAVRNPATIRRWRSRAAAGRPRNKERIDDLRTIAAMLINSGLLYPEQIGRFLRGRNPDLDFRRPLALLGRGDFDSVRHAAELLLDRLAGLDAEAATAAAPSDVPRELPADMRRVAPSQSGADPVVADEDAYEGGRESHDLNAEVGHRHAR